MDKKNKSTTLVFDPEDEYLNLAKVLGGERITLNSGSTSYLNPFCLDFGRGFIDKRLEILEEEIFSNESKVLDNPYGDISKIKRELKYCKNPFQRKDLEKKLQGALKCKKVNKNKTTDEEILKEKILNEVKRSLREEKGFLSEEEYLNIFYEELKEVVSSYENVEFNEEENCLVFKF